MLVCGPVHYEGTTNRRMIENSITNGSITTSSLDLRSVKTGWYSNHRIDSTSLQIDQNCEKYTSFGGFQIKLL